MSDFPSVRGVQPFLLLLAPREQAIVLQGAKILASNTPPTDAEMEIAKEGSRILHELKDALDERVRRLNERN